ncbi:MAG: hypothetical protein IJC19_07250, partial [Clostridia bacterium]|nr:hypothetical protein [Clostridia bacterium]
MKRGSFSAAVILCIVSLLSWFVPSLILPLIGVSALLAIVSLIIFLKNRKIIFRDFLFYAVCLLLCHEKFSFIIVGNAIHQSNCSYVGKIT